MPNTLPIADPDLPQGRYSLDFVLTFTCLPGFINAGSATARCADREWRVGSAGAPNCEGLQFVYGVFFAK